jgi:hypothetical protein
VGAAYALGLVERSHRLDAWLPVFAGALVLAAELAFWSIEQRVPAWAEPGLALRRIAALVATVAATMVAAALVLVVAGAPFVGGVAAELVAVGAAALAATVLAMVVRLARA